MKALSESGRRHHPALICMHACMRSSHWPASDGPFVPNVTTSRSICWSERASVQSVEKVNPCSYPTQSSSRLTAVCFVTMTRSFRRQHELQSSCW